MSLTKTATVDPAADQNAVKVGDRISYAYRVTNAGNVTLISVAVSDPSAGNVTCPTPAAPGLAPGASETCTADDPHPVTQVDVDNGGVSDTATATGIDTQGNQSRTSSPATVTVPAITAAPGVSVQKFASAANGDTNPISAGEQILYSYLVTNTGNVDLTSLAVSDNKVGAVTCPTPAAPGLAPGAFETCTGTYTATTQDAINNNITNTATATGTDAAGAVSPTSPPTTYSIPQASAAPAVSIQKSGVVTPASDQDGVVVGDHISYSYIVTNVGNVNLTSVAVNDPTAGSVTCPALTGAGLAPGGSVTCTEDIAYQVTQADVDKGVVTDAATATGTATIAGNTVTSPASDPASVTTPAGTDPAVSIVKAGAVTPAADQTGVKPGDTIQYTYLVTNIGNATLSSISVNDPTAGHVTCPTPAPPGLAPGAAETCTADNTYTVTQDDVDAGGVSDTATASGIDLLGTTSPASSGSLSVPAEPADPELSVAKHGTDTNPADQNDIRVGDTIDYSYQVTNTGDVTLTTVAVTDPTLGSVTCPALPPQGLAPGASITCTADNAYTVTQADIDTGGASDEATATGADANGDSTSTFMARADVLAVPAPRVSMVKSASVTPAADQDDAQVGDVISYSFLVTNTGNVDLTSISVSDSSLGPVSCPIPAPPGLAPGDSETCTGEIQHTVTAADRSAGSVTDTSTATGTDASGDTSPASAPSTATVPVGHVVVPTASGGGGTAAATKLSIVKRVSRASAYPGQKLTYTLTVTNDGPTTATDVEVTDSPSIPIKIISIRPQQGSCRHSQGITCSLGTVLVGQTVKVTINGQVERSGTELNTARVTSAELPLDPASMVATAATKVTPILQIHKSPSVGHAVTGQNITYRITVTNPTLVAISKVTVCDSLPSGLLYLSSSPGAAMRRGRPCWSIAKLPAGRSKRFTLVANVAPGHSGKLVNRANATAPGVIAGHAAAGVRVTETPPVACPAASTAASSDGSGASGRPPIAKAAC